MISGWSFAQYFPNTSKNTNIYKYNNYGTKVKTGTT
jgi:hypothetical protein